MAPPWCKLTYEDFIAFQEAKCLEDFAPGSGSKMGPTYWKAMDPVLKAAIAALPPKKERSNGGKDTSKAKAIYEKGASKLALQGKANPSWNWFFSKAESFSLDAGGRLCFGKNSHPILYIEDMYGLVRDKFDKLDDSVPNKKATEDVANELYKEYYFRKETLKGPFIHVPVVPSSNNTPDPPPAPGVQSHGRWTTGASNPSTPSNRLDPNLAFQFWDSSRISRDNRTNAIQANNDAIQENNRGLQKTNDAIQENNRGLQKTNEFLMEEQQRQALDNADFQALLRGYSNVPSTPIGHMGNLDDA